MAPPTFRGTITRITNAPPPTRRTSPECQCQCSPSGTSHPCQILPLPVRPEPSPLTTIEQQIQERCRAAAMQLLEPAFRELVAGIATTEGTAPSTASTPTFLARRSAAESRGTIATTDPSTGVELTPTTTLALTERAFLLLNAPPSRLRAAPDPPPYEAGPPRTYAVVGALLDHPILAHIRPRHRHSALRLALRYDQAPGLIGRMDHEGIARTQRARELVSHLVYLLQTAIPSIGDMWNE
jgi:hypothetical protein